MKKKKKISKLLYNFEISESFFLRVLDFPLINCEISLDLIWSKNCVLTSKATRNRIAAQGDNPLVTAINN